MIHHIANNVYKVITSGGSGSSFFLKEKGIFVTNYHVIAGNRQVTLEDHSLNRYLARVILINPEADIAFLSSEHQGHENSEPIRMQLERGVTASEKVYVLGFPYGMPYTVTEGIVSAPRQLMSGRHYIQTDAAVNPGNSGGPVVDAEGRLIGITTSKFTDADNMGFAIPVHTLYEELESLNDHSGDEMVLKCSSCSYLIKEASEYCDNCGSEINKQYFEVSPLSQFSAFVEESISEMGENPVLARAGYEFWEFHHGSSQIRIFVYNKHYMYATSPLNTLPKSNLEALYKYLLSDPVKPYQLGIHDNQIFISYRTAMSDLFTGKRDEIKRNLMGLWARADEMDNFFVKEYGCELTHYSKVV